MRGLTGAVSCNKKNRFGGTTSPCPSSAAVVLPSDHQNQALPAGENLCVSYENRDTLFQILLPSEETRGINILLLSFSGIGC